jgi:hypothetical protein
MFGFPCFYVKNYTHVVSINLKMCLHDNVFNISNKNVEQFHMNIMSIE